MRWNSFLSLAIFHAPWKTTLKTWKDASHAGARRNEQKSHFPKLLVQLRKSSCRGKGCFTCADFPSSYSAASHSHSMFLGPLEQFFKQFQCCQEKKMKSVSWTSCEHSSLWQLLLTSFYTQVYFRLSWLLTMGLTSEWSGTGSVSERKREGLIG